MTGDGRALHELPENWVVGPMLLRPRRAPVLVIQVALPAGDSLLLAATLPDPYFLDSANPLTRDRLLLQGATLLTVLVLVLAVARTVTRPLQRITDAAAAFGGAMHPTTMPARPAPSNCAARRARSTTCRRASSASSRIASACSRASRTT